MGVLPCLFACVIAHGPLDASLTPGAAATGPVPVFAAGAFAPAAVTPDGTARFALHSEWFGPDFAIRPAAPDADDVIRFTDPWGNRPGYQNRCVTAGFYGDPHVHVDHALHQVRIEFTGGQFQLPVDRVCQAVVEDVGGLTGQFGPLEPGTWTYRAGDDAPHTFTVVPEPTTGMTLLAPALLLFRRRRRTQ